MSKTHGEFRATNCPECVFYGTLCVFFWLPGCVRINAWMFSLLMTAQFSFVVFFFLCIFRNYLCISQSPPSARCKHVCAEAIWPRFDSIPRRAFIVTDGSINIMKFNLKSAVCLYLYACVLAEFTSMRWLFATLHTRTSFLSTRHFFRVSNFFSPCFSRLLECCRIFLLFGSKMSLEFRLLLSSGCSECVCVFRLNSKLRQFTDLAGMCVCVCVCYPQGSGIRDRKNTHRQIVHHLSAGESDRSLFRWLSVFVFDLFRPLPVCTSHWFLVFFFFLLASLPILRWVLPLCVSTFVPCWSQTTPEDVGLRVQFDASRNLLLNRRRCFAKGACCHQKLL